MTQEIPYWLRTMYDLMWKLPFQQEQNSKLKDASSEKSKNENKPPVFIANMQYRGLVPQPLLTHAEVNAMVYRNAKRKEMGRRILKKAAKLGLKPGNSTNNNVRSAATTAVRNAEKPTWL